MDSTKIPEKTKNCLFELDQVRETYGYSTYYDAFKIQQARRLEVQRTEERKRYKWPTDYKRLYREQRGICPYCDKEMAFIKGALDIDHFDPNSKTWNAEANLRVLHLSCNRSKGADSVYTQARKSGKTVKELLEQQQSLHND